MKNEEYHMANFENGFNFKQAQYCINKIFELPKSCIWAISKWM